MANRADTAWNDFFEYFINMKGTAAEIAAEFNRGLKRPVVTSRQVADWRRRHSRPTLAELPELGYHWKNDPLFFARMLRAIPPDGIETELWLQRRLLELRGELHELEATVRSHDTTEATGRIVAAAITSGKWAVAVHPAMEGPTGIPIHVADRLDFRRLAASSEPGETDREQLEADLEHAFSRTHIVYSPAAESTWATSGGGPEPTLRYALAHTTASFSPARVWDHVGVRSVAVVSLTLGTWPTIVAALVARMLGYGFVSTRALSRSERPHGRIPTDAESGRYRANVHHDLLQHPWHRYVWGHVGGAGVDPEAILPDQSDPGLAIIWLRESEELIKGWAAGTIADTRARRRFVSELERQHDVLAHASARGASVHEIVCETRGAGPYGLREPRWDRSFELAADVVEHLVASKAVKPNALLRGIDELTSAAHPDPINQAVAHWLQKSGRTTKWRDQPTR